MADIKPSFIKEKVIGCDYFLARQTHQRTSFCVCEACGFLTNNYEIQKHLKQHQYNYKCCDESFVYKQHLYNHYQIAHPVQVQPKHGFFLCYICGCWAKSCRKLHKFIKILDTNCSLDDKSLISPVEEINPLLNCSVKYEDTSVKLLVDDTYKLEHYPSASSELTGTDNKLKHYTSTSVELVGAGNYKSKRYTFKLRYFACGNCDYITKTEYELNQHFAIHVFYHKCFKCEDEFEDKFLFRQHVNYAHPDPDRRRLAAEPRKLCYICGKMVTKKIDLRHLNIHLNPENNYITCITCGKQVDRFRLKLHSRIHTGEKPFECTVCGNGKAFRTKTKLELHMRIHNKEKPYKCKVCEKCFTQWCGLNFHMRMHTNEKPYKCSICDREFAHSSSLTGHMKVHARASE